jgi:adenylate cyclase class IV
MLEIEKRGFLTEEKYKWLHDFLDKNGKNLGEDDKDVVYYIYSDKLLKVVNNITKKTAKVSLKMNKIGEGSVFPETEVHFDQNDFDKLKYVFDVIASPQNVKAGEQKRSNYEYKGCEISVKWSPDWSFYFEIEKMVDGPDGVEQVEKEIHSIADELGIVILTEEELKEFNAKSGQ